MGTGSGLGFGLGLGSVIGFRSGFGSGCFGTGFGSGGPGNSVTGFDFGIFTGHFPEIERHIYNERA